MPTAKTGPENTFAMYHSQNKCHLHRVMLPGILTVSASFWIWRIRHWVAIDPHGKDKPERRDYDWHRQLGLNLYDGKNQAQSFAYISSPSPPELSWLKSGEQCQISHRVSTAWDGESALKRFYGYVLSNEIKTSLALQPFCSQGFPNFWGLLAVT